MIFEIEKKSIYVLDTCQRLSQRRYLKTNLTLIPAKSQIKLQICIQADIILFGALFGVPD